MSKKHFLYTNSFKYNKRIISIPIKIFFNILEGGLDKKNTGSDTRYFKSYHARFWSHGISHGISNLITQGSDHMVFQINLK